MQNLNFYKPFIIPVRKVDKKLELRLIERGYDPASASEVSLADAGKIIREKIYDNSRNEPAGITVPAGMIFLMA